MQSVSTAWQSIPNTAKKVGVRALLALGFGVYAEYRRPFHTPNPVKIPLHAGVVFGLATVMDFITVALGKVVRILGEKIDEL